MHTCKYCGSQLSYIGEYKDEHYFFCDYCDLSFDETDTCKDRKRKSSVPNYYNVNYYLSTKELLKCNTIALFHLLKDCRKDWYSTFTLLKQLIDLNDNEMPDSNSLDDVSKPLYNEYVQLTKQKFIIENILIEKAGFIPEKITDDFLNSLIEQSKLASDKPMYIYIKKGV